MDNVYCQACKRMVPPGRFCSNCASPLTATTQPIQPNQTTRPQQYIEVPSQLATRINLVCPKCEGQNQYPIIETQSLYNFICPNCRTAFISRLARIRSKNSRGSKKDARRNFSVRVYDITGGESLIEFVNAGTQDFELRARDAAVFSYIESTLIIVQNLTIGQYMKVSKPGCYIATYIYGPNSNEVMLLRRFRDEVLLLSHSLSVTVSLYYYFSAKAVNRFENNKVFRATCAIILKPIVWLTRKYISNHRREM